MEVTIAQLGLLFYFAIVFLVICIAAKKNNKRKNNYNNNNSYFYNNPRQNANGNTWQNRPDYFRQNPTDRSWQSQHGNSAGFQEPPMYPYIRKNLLTDTEHQFYRILKGKCDQNNIIVCPKVRLEDFINVTVNENKLKYRGYIRSRHVDFILCDRNLNIIAGVELDDNSHKSVEARKIDDFKNKLFYTIRIPLHRVPIGSVNFSTAVDGIIESYKMFDRFKQRG